MTNGKAICNTSVFILDASLTNWIEPTDALPERLLQRWKPG